jgi:hypothetical protein
MKDLSAKHDPSHRATADAFDPSQQLGLGRRSSEPVMSHPTKDGAQRQMPALEVHRIDTGLTIWTLPQRSHSIRRNHEGKASNGEASASLAVGSGSVP